ncbi:hypothetical protein GCM10009037_15790 [Halarchaeum grantii]|uniref:Uncharacterized protein n=2 Tax=Halarchaeum grantii TaxID=1193105 RepID=A0A830FCD5_9EURY|nr:hypothetical protein GCM10009037_15790 [Halarchaeum grantii]
MNAARLTVRMTRTDAVRVGAFYGLLGTAIITLGTLLADAALSELDLWLGVPLAAVVWAGCVYVGLKEVAKGLHAVVADASAD